MDKSQKRLLLLGGIGLGALFLLNRPGGLPGTPGGGQTWHPGDPAPAGYAIGHDLAGNLILVPIHG